MTIVCTRPVTLLLLILLRQAMAFIRPIDLTKPFCWTNIHHLSAQIGFTDTDVEGTKSLRRHLLQSSFLYTFSLVSLTLQPAFAVERQSLDSVLYRIMRVKEAVGQEARLIKSGKFKDVQRANVKLAVRFMIQNYRLNDAFVVASGYLEGNDRRVEAGQVGQSTVQNLYTILEYFDSSDVENIKVSFDLLF